MQLRRYLKYNRRFSSSSLQDPTRIVIVGGVAGGATAAARISRLNKNAEVIVVERSPDVSFANCGLPYHIGGEIKDRSVLSLHTPESLSELIHAKVLTNTTVTKIDRSSKHVSIEAMNGEKRILAYDKLILSPGASPLRPNIPGIHDPRIMTLRNLQDMDKIIAALQSIDCKTVAVIGGGFIGLEMVEQLHHLGKRVHLVDKAPAVLPQADVDMAQFLHAPLKEKGIGLTLGDGLASFAAQEQGLQVRLDSGKTISADVVILSIGVVPESSLAREAGLRLNPRGYVVVDEFMRTSDPDIYAAGDVVETNDLVFPERKATVALGNIANMQARIAADHMVLGKSVPYRGSLGTSIVRAFDCTFALTGWTETRLRAANIPYSTTIVTANNHAGYYPMALPITMKITFDPETGRVYGGQAVGVEGVDKRIDVIATAITGQLTVDDLSLTQLTYSPPFGSARDVVNVAGLAARNLRDHLIQPAYSLENIDPKRTTVVDVRPKEVASLSPIPNSINIPLKEVANCFPTLDKNMEYLTVCALGKTSYFCSRFLSQCGFQVKSLIGGLRMHDKPWERELSGPASSSSQRVGASPATASSPKDLVVDLDCCGLSCPGPLMKLKHAVDTHRADTTVFHVTATDPGFKTDVKAFAAVNNMEVTHCSSEKGIITAHLRRTSASPTPSSTEAAATESSLVSTAGERKGATIVVFSEDMDKVLAALVIANGAAAMGGPVTLFFTFWGLNFLRDPTRHANGSKDVVDSLFGMMMPKGKDRLPLSHMNFGGLGSIMMKYVMEKKHLPNLAELLDAAKQQKIRLVACTMSMEAMGIRPEELIEGVEYGGVAEYLGSAHKTGTNLFI